MLANGEFDAAKEDFDQAFDLTATQPRLRSSISVLRGLAGLRLHDVGELSLDRQRHDREEGLTWLQKAVEDGEHGIPEAWFGRGVLAYETNDLEGAERFFEQCLKSSRRATGRDEGLLNRARFYLASSLISAGKKSESVRAVRLIEQALETVAPDLETFYSVHEELKTLDRRVALKFLDAVEIDRGTAPDQLLIVALEYLVLGEGEPAANAAERVLEVAVDLDQRMEAMRVILTANNMRGEREAARQVFQEMRELLLQRGAFNDLEDLLKNEEVVGQALDHLEIKCELVNLYEEMEDREIERVTLQCAIARSLRARKDPEALQEAFGILKEVEISFPDLAQDELRALQKLLALNDTDPVDPKDGAGVVSQLTENLGRKPTVLVVGGNERQRRHHPRFQQLADEWGFEGEWWMANYTSPQKLVNQIGDRLKSGLDLLILLHWNRHETTEPALELARKAGVPARTVHYVGFTSLQVSLLDQFNKLSGQPATSK